MRSSVLQIFSRDLSTFYAKVEAQRHQSLRFSEVDPSKSAVDVTKPPPPPTASQMFRLYEQDDFLREAFDYMIQDSQDLAQTEFGVEAFMAQREKWETQLRNVEEDICLQNGEEKQLLMQSIIYQLYLSTKRQDQQPYLMSQLQSLMTANSNVPLLEMLKFVQFIKGNPGSTSIYFLQRCFVSELKASAKYSSKGSKIDIKTSRLAANSTFQSDAAVSGRTLRTKQESDEIMTWDGYSLYGQLYNCIKCGYMAEIIELIDKNPNIDAALKECIEELLENDFWKGKPLRQIDEQNNDQYYLLLTQLFRPHSAEYAVTPSFLDQIYIYLISQNTCYGQDIEYVQASYSASSVKALIYLLQGQVGRCLTFLFNNSLFVELFLLSIFVQDELTDTLFAPKSLEQAGNDVVMDIVNKKRELPSTPLVLTRFIDVINAKQPNLINYTEYDLMDSLTLFNSQELRVSVLLAQAYLLLLRGSNAKDANAFYNHFLAKYWNYKKEYEKAVQAVIFSIRGDSRGEIENAAVFYNAMINYLRSLLVAPQIDTVKLADIIDAYKHYDRFQQFYLVNLGFLETLLEAKIQLIKGQNSAAKFNMIAFKYVDAQFFGLVRTEVIQCVFWILGQFQKFGVKFERAKAREAATLFHCLRLTTEEEQIVAELERMVY